MPKVSLTCAHCSNEFTVFPAALRHAERRGTPVQFCSRACLGAARSAGAVKAKTRRGTVVTCAVCASSTYRSPKRLKEGRTYLCSEACRLTAHAEKLIDRTQPRPNRMLGMEVECCVCRAIVYRKKSMIERNVDKTCGSPDCMSTYSRSLWGLPPYSEEQRKIRKGPSRRSSNFDRKQRREWLETECVRCGSTENLCLDHIIPVSAGGESVLENAQTLCQPCNIWKGNHEDRPLALAYRQSLSGGLQS